MDLSEGDLVITLPRIDQMRSPAGTIKAGLVGVVVETEPKFDNQNVYGVLIDGKVYYLFRDEIEKVEKK